MSQLINIFLEPAKAFRALQDKPGFVLPMLLLAVGSGLFGLLYFLYVDPEWFARHQEAQVLAGNPDMSPQELEQMRRFMPGARTLAWITAPMAIVTVVVVNLIMALYYLLAGKVTGTGISFRRGLCLSAWAGLPGVLGVLAGLAAMYAGSNQVGFESLQMLNVDPLFVQLPMDHDWARLAKSFSLLNLWSWFLAALGWRTWFNTGWGQAIVVSVLPGVLVYGVMAIFAIL
ncbi:YIP1 family protein [Arenimonas fontis]|nr:YIP1 family protein [Arenimonas fontis]